MEPYRTAAFVDRAVKGTADMRSVTPSAGTQATQAALPRAQKQDTDTGKSARSVV
jgi:hypothetical protein